MMHEEPRTLLHDAAPRPTRPVDFDVLWRRGRRRRLRARATTALAAVAMIGVAALALPLPGDRHSSLEVVGNPPFECPVTDVAAAPFTPPAPYLPEPAIDGAVWFGTDELWTAVLPNGPMPIQSLWWSADFGGGADLSYLDIEVVYERLDDPAAEPVVLGPATNAFTGVDGWYMIAGMRPDDPGCWQVTATRFDAELTYVFHLDAHEG